MSLTGKVAIITGGASGIGRATVRRFVDEGAKVVIADLDVDAAQRVVDELEAAGHVSTSRAVRVDVSSWEDVQALVRITVETFGKLDVIFNNAGIAGGHPLVDQDPEKHYYPIMRVDQDGVYFGILAAAKQFRAQGTPGVIISTSSVYGESAGDKAFVYGAAKAAVIAFTRSAALELAEFGIRAVAITPGRVNTPILKRMSDERNAFMANEQMRGKLTEPEEIAEVVAFLASDAANVINGSVIRVEDGYSSYKNRLPA